MCGCWLQVDTYHAGLGSGEDFVIRLCLNSTELGFGESTKHSVSKPQMASLSRRSAEEYDKLHK